MVDRISTFDATELPVRIAAEVRGFDPAAAMDAKAARRSSRFIQFALAAAAEALADGGLDVRQSPERYGCFLGVGVGALSDVETAALSLRDEGPRKVSPFLIPYTIPNMAAGVVSIAQGLEGPNMGIATACASGAHAIGEALLHIQHGSAEAMLAGGAEAVLGPLVVTAFARMGALSTNNDHPREASRPFDRDRDGFVMGEGAGVLLLEEYEHAKRRGARIYAELAGYGLSADAYHISAMADGKGLRRCMAGALESAGIEAQAVDYINAHGTSTTVNDAVESAAIVEVFGCHAFELSVSSTKGATGHCLGAAGGIEAVYTVLAMHHGVVPPTANHRTPDPECPLDYTPREPRARRIGAALSNSFGFGGQNACLAFKQLE